MNTVKQLKDGLETVSAIRQKLQTAEADLAEAQAFYQKTAATGDLRDTKTLAGLATALTKIAAYPTFIEATDAALTAAEDAFVNACGEFISNTVTPLINDLAAKTKAQLEAELRPHFTSAAHLAQAIENSDRISKIRQLGFIYIQSGLRGSSVDSYAKSIMQTHQQAVELMKQFKS